MAGAVTFPKLPPLHLGFPCLDPAGTHRASITIVNTTTFPEPTPPYEILMSLQGQVVCMISSRHTFKKLIISKGKP